MNQSSGQMTPLTEKDLSYCKDAMAWELVACKKAYQYAHQTLEPECRQLMFQIAEQHQRNMEAIINHLGEHVSQSVQCVTQGAAQGAQPVVTHM